MGLFKWFHGAGCCILIHNSNVCKLNYQIMWHENSNAASESDINLHHVYTGREQHGTVRRDAKKYNRTYYNQ